MHTERLSDDVYVFTSELYYQVTASLIVSGTIGVLIDTLPFPEETVQIAQLVNRLCPDGVRYIIYTQHQADHVYGAAFFPRAEVISHTLCRELMIAHGFEALEQAKTQSPSLNLVRLRLPTITFDKGNFALRLPGKTLELLRLPGHTPDSIAVLFQEEKLLFAGDTIMALPTVSDPGADVAAIRQAIELVAGMQLDCIVQGHGEIILRGEIKENMRRGNHTSKPWSPKSKNWSRPARRAKRPPACPLSSAGCRGCCSTEPSPSCIPQMCLRSMTA
ncbi:MAG: MBL fold metallo-hydrolase [Anaerolineae bacterium]|nr:MBL fold metallo-hydrolase [Anaerolineae bacterium]